MQMAVATPEQPDLPATARTLLLLLLAADLAFIVLHVIYVETSWLRGRPFSLEQDNGLPEAFQYVKQFWIALCMLALFRRTRELVYAGWLLVFTFLLFDDAFQIHEHLGKWLGEKYSLWAVFGLRPDDIGELLFALFVGVLSALLIGFGFWRGDRDARAVSRDTAMLVVVLAVFGVGVDILHVIAYFKGSLSAQLLLIVEDGGEMVVVSVTAAYIFNVLIHEGRSPVNVWDYVGSRLKPARNVAKGLMS